MTLAITISRRVRGEWSFHFFMLTFSTLTGMIVGSLALAFLGDGGHSSARFQFASVPISRKHLASG